MVDALKKDLMHQSGPMAYRKAYRTFREEWGVGGGGGGSRGEGSGGGTASARKTVTVRQEEAGTEGRRSFTLAAEGGGAPLSLGELQGELEGGAAAAPAAAAAAAAAVAAQVAASKQAAIAGTSILPLNLFQTGDRRQALALQAHSARRPNLVYAHLQGCVFPLMKTQGEKLSASGQELASASLFDTRFGFSGTPSAHIPHELGACDMAGANGEVVAVLTDPRFVTHSLKRGWSARQLLLDIATAADGLAFHALIDTGALVTGMSNEEVAFFLLRHGLPAMGGVVYLDEADRKMVAMRSSAAPVPLARCGLAPEARFTYYDQVHTTGMDIPQALQARAVVTLSKDMTLRDYAQGAWRMRKLARGQTLHLYVVEEVLALITDTVPNSGEEARFLPAEVLAFLAINSCRSEAMCAMQTKVKNDDELLLLLLLLRMAATDRGPPRTALASALVYPRCVLGFANPRNCPPPPSSRPPAPSNPPRLPVLPPRSSRTSTT